MFDKMKQINEMRKQAKRIQKELEEISVNVDQNNGIKVQISGSQKFQSIEIDEAQLRAQNKQQIEGELLKTLNAAITQSQQMAAQKMKDSMPGLPGI